MTISSKLIPKVPTMSKNGINSPTTLNRHSLVTAIELDSGIICSNGIVGDWATSALTGALKARKLLIWDVSGTW